jgi:hypothetical protein
MVVVEMKFTRHGVSSNNRAWVSRPVRACPISSNLASIRGLRANITMSHPGGMPGMRGRIDSRRILFARFRWTALPSDRPAATPILEWSSSLGRATSTINGWAYDFPKRLTRSKSVVLVKRNLRFTGWPVDNCYLYPFQFVRLTWLFFFTASL